jgi:hypothetical protein
MKTTKIKIKGRLSRPSILFMCAILSVGFCSKLNAYDISYKTKTLLWGGGASISAILFLLSLIQAEKSKQMLLEEGPYLGDHDKNLIFNKIYRNYFFAGVGLVGTILSGAMVVKNGIDWKNRNRKIGELEYELGVLNDRFLAEKKSFIEGLKRKEKVLKGLEKKLDFKQTSIYRSVRSLIREQDSLEKERKKMDDYLLGREMTILEMKKLPTDDWLRIRKYALEKMDKGPEEEGEASLCGSVYVRSDEESEEEEDGAQG